MTSIARFFVKIYFHKKCGVFEACKKVPDFFDTLRRECRLLSALSSIFFLCIPDCLLKADLNICTPEIFIFTCACIRIGSELICDHKCRGSGDEQRKCRDQCGFHLP